MPLNNYNDKRNFDVTQEPKMILAKSESDLIFVVQKHGSSHLHYDFRLELDGVLKSWTIPKGPSLNPKIKRLAIMVDDHPYSYKDFEGNIPEGNYGAGNVIVWDNGTYIPADTSYSGTIEDKLKTDLLKGHLRFVLKGKKLKGEFALIQLKGKKENAWLLIKKRDSYASSDDVLKNDLSVISKSTLENLKKNRIKNKDGVNVPSKRE